MLGLLHRLPTALGAIGDSGANMTVKVPAIQGSPVGLEENDDFSNPTPPNQRHCLVLLP